MGFEGSLEEEKAKVLMNLRGYRLLKREKMKSGVSFTVETKDGIKALVWVVPPEEAVGVAHINQLKKAMKEAQIERGIVVTSGRYTPSAKTNANKKGIELIPKTFPSFNIFNHTFVPKHETLTTEERKKILTEYKIHPYQLPKINTSDPAITAIGAKPGDIIKITRKSSTAGKYIAYRYVVEG